MKSIKTLPDLQTIFSSLNPRRRVAVVSPHDNHTMEVVERCLKFSLAKFVLVCSEPSAWAMRLAEARADEVSVIQTESPDEAARVAVAEVRQCRADVLMKGAINTDNLLHAVLNKEAGLLPENRVLTHVTVSQIPTYNKLLFFSDAAVIPTPDYQQLKAMISYDTALLKKINITSPRVALIHFSEKTNPKFPQILYYAQLKEDAANGDFGENVLVDGPMDVKSACDNRSAQIKHISSPVTGNADLLIFPNLEAANTFYKTISCFAHATMAGILIGASVPIVLPSRADSADSKFYSLALACIAQ